MLRLAVVCLSPNCSLIPSHLQKLNWAWMMSSHTLHRCEMDVKCSNKLFRCVWSWLITPVTLGHHKECALNWLCVCEFVRVFPWLLPLAVAWQPGIKKIGRKRDRKGREDGKELVGHSLCVIVQYEVLSMICWYTRKCYCPSDHLKLQPGILQSLFSSKTSFYSNLIRHVHNWISSSYRHALKHDCSDRHEY